MHSVGRTLLGLVALVPGCEQVKRIADEGGGACVPAPVQAAFDRSCGGPSCHTDGGMAGGLALGGGQAADAIGRAAVGNPLPLIEIGNTGGSYLAQKIMTDPSVMITGGRMPLGFQASNENQVADINTILSWIAGGDLGECGGGMDSTGMSGTDVADTADTMEPAVQLCGLADLDPAAVAMLDSGTAASQIPPDIAIVLLANCGCHYTDTFSVEGVPDYSATQPFKMDTLAGFAATSPAGTTYAEVARAKVNGEGLPMPSEPFCNIGGGEAMDVDQRATLVEWLTAGAPDCTTWAGCGEMTQACGLEDLKPGADNPIVSGTGAMQLPPDIGTILGDNCGCHLADDLTVAVPDYMGIIDISTWEGFQAPFGVTGPMHETALDYVTTKFMPLKAGCDIGGGEAMPLDQRAVLVEWLTQEAPDGATWVP